MPNGEFKIGDAITISSDAVYYTGQQMSPPIKSRQWYITSISGDRIVLGKSVDGYYALNAPVNARYLTKVIK